MGRLRPDMRITYFTDTPRIGGAERFLADLATGVSSAGHEVTVVSPQPFLLEFIEEGAPGVRAVEGGSVDYRLSRPGLGTIAALGRGAPGLRRIIADTSADLLHVNNGGYPGSDLCRLAAIVARFAGAGKRLLTVHSAPWARETSQPQLQAIVDRVTWRSVDAVHATTTFVAKGLVELRGMPPQLCRHIPYGVSEPVGSNEAVAALRSRLAPAGAGLLVGMLSATADLAKGHDVFVEAVAAADVGLCAVIVGPHPEGRFREKISQLGLGDRVALEGPIASAAVGPYLRAIDLLVVPSTAYESLPLVVLEAMAAGKPVLASRLSGIPEAVVDGETGYLFEPGNIGELTALLREAAEAPDRLPPMGQAGHERWRAQFSVAAMTTSMLAFYEELTAS